VKEGRKKGRKERREREYCIMYYVEYNKEMVKYIFGMYFTC